MISRASRSALVPSLLALGLLLVLLPDAGSRAQSRLPRSSGPPSPSLSSSPTSPPSTPPSRHPAAATPPDVGTFFDAASLDDSRAEPARERIAAAWRDGYAAPIVDMIDLMRRTSFVDPASWIRLNRLVGFLERQTGQSFGLDVDGWRRWTWALPYSPPSDYGAFKARLYAQLDPRFAEFFAPPVHASIRLDEVEWGGVPVNGIPPLDHPKSIPAREAEYLDDGNVVFGVFIDGAARAYPQRILAWHELASDRLGGREITLVYCTLCGTAIPYASRVGGRVRRFGTSGLLYESNKLMFDAGTHSLWSSIDGRPVVGPLVGSGLRLEALPIVTTSWGEWRRRHPDTTVLSIATGFARDYSEGAAYRDYFSTDQLMFDVSKHDSRLPNKAEVLVLRLPPSLAGDTGPVAISADFLSRHPVYEVDIPAPRLVVITSPAGANRVYLAGARRFTGMDAAGRVRDGQGRAWTVSEDALRATFDPTLELARVPAHRAFWFGWFAQHPDTLLIK